MELTAFCASDLHVLQHCVLNMQAGATPHTNKIRLDYTGRPSARQDCESKSRVSSKGRPFSEVMDDIDTCGQPWFVLFLLSIPFFRYLNHMFKGIKEVRACCTSVKCRVSEGLWQYEAYDPSSEVF
eukprot:scaffold273350_cov20-Tisochrysis_lutea.AAC.1